MNMFIMKVIFSQIHHIFGGLLVVWVRVVESVAVETLSKKIGLLGNIGRLSLLCYCNNIAVYYCLFSLRCITNLTTLVLNASC